MTAIQSSNITVYVLFVFTKAWIIIAIVTQSISFLSSLIIITIVLRSMNGIQALNHRIVLEFSFVAADSLTFFAIALTTISMPKTLSTHMFVFVGRGYHPLGRKEVSSIRIMPVVIRRYQHNKRDRNMAVCSLVLTSKEANGDGTAFPLETVNKPSKAAKEALNSDYSTNIS